jgi:hypothetical protein
VDAYATSNNKKKRVVASIASKEIRMSTTHVKISGSAGRKAAMPTVPSAKPASRSGFAAAAIAKSAQCRLIDDEAKRLMIAEAAYYRAEKRGFVPGGELQDWLEAETQVAAMRGT